MHNPVSRYNTGNLEHQSELSLFKGQLGTSGGHKMHELNPEEWANIMLYVLINIKEAWKYQ
jgi:hypothetical protein